MRTREQAKKMELSGYNIRCNLCGNYGADWISEQRPNWGCLALCEVHKNELQNEIKRHNNEMSRLRTINFEQDIPKKIGLPDYY